MDSIKIIGMGELVWDMLPTGKCLGGAPVNFAYWCNRLGAESFPITAIGRDELGEEAITALQGTHIELDYIQRNVSPTGCVHVTLSGEGIPQYEIVEQVAWDAIEADERTLALAAQADAICWGSLAQRSAKSRQSILAILDATPKDCLKIFDINIRQHWYNKELIVESLQKADVLKLNEDELPLIISLLEINKPDSEAIADIIRMFSLQYVIYTAGADYSEIHSREGLLSSIPTPKVEVVDTVGAGDSFTAAFVTSILQGKSIADSHQYAVEIAAKVCTMKGAMLV